MEIGDKLISKFTAAARYVTDVHRYKCEFPGNDSALISEPSHDDHHYY